MLSDARIAEIAAVEAAAPKGPFTVGTSDAGALLVYIPGTAPLYIGDMAETVAADHALADFLADARQAVPELLAEVARLRASEARAVHFALRGRGVPLPYPLASEGDT